MSDRDTFEAWIVEEHVELDVDALGRACHCSRDWIVALVQEGVLQPADPQAAQWRFRGESLRRARRATRLGHDLDLNPAGIALVLDLLERIDALERRLHAIAPDVAPP